MIDLERLRIFVQCAENLSFTQAARELHVSQPTISHHIKALEREIGAPLFLRLGGGLQLSEEGRVLLPWARKLLREAIQLEEMMASVQDRIVGQLRIACSTTTGKYILPLIAARFHERHQRVRVSIMRCTAEQVVPRLMEAEANLGVVSHEVSGGNMECQVFFIDHIILIAQPHHPWAGRRLIEASELVGQPIIMREPTSGTRRVMFAELGKHDIAMDDLDVFLEVGNTEAIVKTVEAGYGVAFVSRLAAQCALERGSVVEIKVADMEMHRNVYMVRKALETPSRAVEAFWGFVHDPVNQDLISMAEI